MRTTAADIAIVALCTAFFQLGALMGGFHYDDIASIVENPHIRSLQNIPDFFTRPELFSDDPRGAMYRPLVLLSYALNYALGEYDAELYLWVNLLIHVLCSILTAAIFSALFKNRPGALIAGLSFGLHPVNAEVVNYISSRSESLCALFFLSAFWGYIRGRQAEGPALLWFGGSLVCFAGALLAKAVGIALPAILVLYEILLAERVEAREVRRRILKYNWAFWLAGCTYLVGMKTLLHKALIAEPVRELSTQICTQIKAYVYYCKLIWLPGNLSVEHQFRLSDRPGEVQVLSALLLLGSLALLMWAQRGERRAGIFWFLWPVAVLLPTTIVPLNVLVNEHRLYLPAVAFAVLLAKLAGRVGGYRWTGVGLAGLCIGIYGILTYERAQVWESGEALWTDAVHKAPLMPRPHIWMGTLYEEQGKHGRALAEYQQALEVYPRVLSGRDRLIIYNNMGASYLALGRWLEALAAYQKALAVDSTYAKSKEALEALLALQNEGDKPEAEKLRLQGLKYLVAGEIDRAIYSFFKALEKQSQPRTWLALAQAFERKQDWDAALQAYEILKLVSAKNQHIRLANERIRAIEHRKSSSGL